MHGAPSPSGVAAGDVPDPAALLLGFARRLRAAGADVSGERVRAYLRAVETLRPWARRDVYWSGRLTLCGGPDDLARHDREFAAWFGTGGPSAPAPGPAKRGGPDRRARHPRGAGVAAAVVGRLHRRAAPP
ncbi:hypothetical protein [Streptomyces sp. NPDC093594]|uniref:hypothetical protein n=1 Tax=Streptomyces sp. NPDC093594 TaxID=3155305 RepID=UPI00344B00CB